MEERTMHRALLLRLKASLDAMVVAFSQKSLSRGAHRDYPLALRAGKFATVGAAIALLLWAILNSWPYGALVLLVSLLLWLVLGSGIVVPSEREQRYRQLAASEERQALAIETRR